MKYSIPYDFYEHLKRAEDCSFARKPTTVLQELKPYLTCGQTLYTDKTTESHIPPHHANYSSHLKWVRACFSLPAPFCAL